MIELKRFVERVVRPVPADVWNKLRMREELYAHLLDAYEHERRATNDEIEAQRKAIARMGEPEVLTAELRSTVSWSERWSRWCNEFFFRRSGERLWAMALRVTAVMAAWMIILMTGACLPQFDTIVAWNPRGQITFRLLGAMFGCLSLGTFLLVPLGEVVTGRMAVAKSWRETLGAGALMAVCCFTVALTLGIVVHVGASWSLAELPAGFRSWLPAALAGAAISVGACIAAAKERRATAPWLELEIDG